MNLRRLVRYEAPDLVQEARFVAQVVAGYGLHKRIAVAVGTLDKRAFIFQDALQRQGLEIAVGLLADLLGQPLDLLVIADCVHGRLNWSARKFLNACSLASELLVLTSSMQDDQSQAQVMSALAKLEFLGPNEGIEKLKRPLDKLEQLFNAAKNQVRPVPDVRGNLNKTQFREKFGDLLGLNPYKPLSATRIEAFAHCRFKAFVEKLLKIELNPAPKYDIDARVLGRLAHTALEKYYRDGVRFHETLEAAHPQETHLGVWKANLIWLEEALERLVSNLARNPPIEHAKSVKFEYRPRSWKMQVAEDEIYVGGIIDRVDQSPDAQIVIDYKMSAMSALKMRFAAKELLQTHFQIPIYLKLLESDEIRKGQIGQRRFIGYPISIQDGGPGPMIDMTHKMPELEQALQNLLAPVLQGSVPSDVQTACRECRLKRVCRV